MEQGEISLSDREFSRIKNRVYQVAGISLSDAKRTLVISRLSKIVRALGLPSFDAYVDYLERGGSAQDGQDFINALTTNLTRFYREDHHFEHLRSYVGALIAEKPRGTRLRRIVVQGRHGTLMPQRHRRREQLRGGQVGVAQQGAGDAVAVQRQADGTPHAHVGQ